MNGRQRVLILIAIMSAITLSVTVISIATLYDAALEQQRERMQDAAEAYATVVRAAARAAGPVQDNYTIADVLEVTLDMMPPRDPTGSDQGRSHNEFVLAERQGDDISFLFLHEADQAGEYKINRIAFDSEFGEPMRRALSGESGTIVGLDLRGKEVLAGFTAIGELGLGVVVKIGLQDLRRPYIQTAVVATLISGALIIFGMGLIHRIGMSFVQTAEESDVRHRSVLDTTSEGYWRVDALGRTVEVNRALCRMLGHEAGEII